jgi:predicted Zn-dependent protease
MKNEARGAATTVTAGGKFLFWKWIVSFFALLFWFSSYTSGDYLTEQRFQQTPGVQASASRVLEARTLLARGNPNEAIRILLEHLSAQPKDSSARLTLGQAYAMTGQTEQAEAELRAVIQESPSNSVALAALGELYAGGGELEKAESFLARAAKTMRSSPQIRMEWSVVLARLHRYKEAKEALAGVPLPNDKAEQISFHRLAASIELGLGNSSRAAAEMENALALKPNDADIALATAATELQDKRWERAANLAEPLFARTHETGTGLLLLEAELGMGAEYQRTLHLLDSANTDAAEAVEFRQRVAELLIAYEKFSEAAEEFKEAAALEPNRPGLLFNLALARFRAGQLDDALWSAEKCKDFGDSAEIEDLLGDIQEARGDNLAAVRSYQAAVALAPNEEKYRLSLAVEFIRHKNFDAAKVVLKQAEEFQPAAWRIQLALGMVEYFTGTDQEATKILVRTVHLAPDPTIVLKYLGDIQIAQASAPDADALATLCRYSERHAKDGKIQFYCGALIFRRDYASGDKTHSEQIVGMLSRASRLLPADPSPRCQLGRVYRWLDRWQDALHESEACVRMDPDSAEGHYRLAQIYQRLGQQERSNAEMKVYESASKRVADENAKRDETIKSFLYTIQKEAPNHK